MGPRAARRGSGRARAEIGTLADAGASAWRVIGRGGAGRPRLAHPAPGDARWGHRGRGAGIANVELPAIARLAGGNSVSLPATTPNSAHLRPTRRPDAAFMRPNHP